MEIYYVDGEFVESDEAVIPVNDLALLRGFGVFDLLRTYGGRPFFLEAHIERLFNSAAEINLHLPWSTDDIVDIVLETMARNRHLAEANIRIVVTGGPSPDFSTPQNTPRLLILVSPVPTLPAEWYTEGVKIITVYTERFKPGAKSISYIPATIAMESARKVGAVEAVYLDRNKRILEGTTSNIFAFVNGGLVTPGADILSGITRQVILDISREMFSVETRDMFLDELLAAEEVFITGTNKGLVPVVRIDERQIGDGRPGANTRRIMAALKAHTRSHAESGDQPDEKTGGKTGDAP